jgi:hypothetical protein
LLKDSGEFSNLIEEYLQKKGEEAEGEEVLEEIGKIDPEKRAKLDRQLSRSSKSETNSPISRNASNDEENREGKENNAIIRRRKHLDSQNVENGDVKIGEKKTMKTKIIEKEEVFTGKVKFNVYLGYLQGLNYN